MTFWYLSFSILLVIILPNLQHLWIFFPYQKKDIFFIVQYSSQFNLHWCLKLIKVANIGLGLIWLTTINHNYAFQANS